MNLFTKAPRPPRASGKDPAMVHPTAWNKLVDYVVSLEGAIRQIMPCPSADIIPKTSSGGTAYSLARRSGVDVQGCPLRPYLRIVEMELRLHITDGLSADAVPTFESVALDPTQYAVLTANTKLWLVVEWEPTSETIDGEYFITGGGTHVSSDFQVSDTRPTETQAAIDITTGAATNGVYAFCWAIIDAESYPPAITSRRCGNHYFTFCPGSLRLIFD